MQMMTLTIAVLVAFQVKHFVADYLLQPAWVLRGKGSLLQIGGYAHAGAHALGSLPVLGLAGTSLAAAIVLASAEFVIHYAIDHSKALLSARTRSGPDTRSYWALHGADQLLHHLTYSALLLATSVW